MPRVTGMKWLWFIRGFFKHICNEKAYSTEYGQFGYVIEKVRCQYCSICGELQTYTTYYYDGSQEDWKRNPPPC